MPDLAALANQCWAVLKQELGVKKTNDIPDTWNEFILHFLQVHRSDGRPLKKLEDEFRTAVKRRLGQSQ